MLTREAPALPPVVRQTGKTPRLEFIDLLRGWAVLIMIETHTVNALLTQAYRNTWWFDWLDFFNGLVAPSFLFCAGCGLWIAINRKWDDYIHFRQPLRKYVGRMLWILGVAYALHLPTFSFKRIYQAFSPEYEEIFFQIDILHTIVVTSLFAVLVIIVTRSKRILLWTSGVFAAALVLCAPLVWALARGGAFAVIIRNMLTESPRSYFPFVPWSAFVFIGIIATKLFMDAENKALFFRRLFFAGLGMMATGWIFRLYYNPYPSELWRSTPIYFVIRLGMVVMAFSGMWMYGEWKKQRAASVKSGVLLLFGRESLLVYAAHLIIVYGSVANSGIASQYAMTFTPAECAGVWILLTLAMWLLAYGWKRLKQNHLTASRMIQYSMAALFVLFLIVND